jgi:hypothetical protein
MGWPVAVSMPFIAWRNSKLIPSSMARNRCSLVCRIPVADPSKWGLITPLKYGTSIGPPAPTPTSRAAAS